MTTTAAGPPILFYRATCSRCRFLSATIVALSSAWVRRIPVDSPEALKLYAQFRETPGTLALFYRESFHTGWAIPAFVLLALLEGVAGAAGLRHERGARDTKGCRRCADGSTRSNRHDAMFIGEEES
jgi:hypothetical protein